MSPAQPIQVDVNLYLHVRVLVGIILGLSVTRLIGGIASFIQHPTRYRVSFLHLGWVAWTLMNVIAFWWWEYGLRLIERWNLALYVFVCFYASMYYFLSALLFPNDVNEYDGYQDYFLSRRVWFFSFVAVSEVLDLVDTWIKGSTYFWSFGTELIISVGVSIVLCAIAASTRNLTFHALFVIIGILYEGIGFVRYFYVLS